MTGLWHKYRWIPENILGSTLFALGFALFLAPNNINTGGISGLAMVLVEVLDIMVEAVAFTIEVVVEVVLT